MSLKAEVRVEKNHFLRMAAYDLTHNKVFINPDHLAAAVGNVIYIVRPSDDGRPLMNFILELISTIIENRPSYSIDQLRGPYGEDFSGWDQEGLDYLKVSMERISARLRVELQLLREEISSRSNVGWSGIRFVGLMKDGTIYAKMTA